MKLISYQGSTGPRAAGIRTNGQCVDLNRADPELPTCIKAILGQGAAGLERAQRAIESGPSLKVDEIQPLPPVPNPEKILCIGLNYSDHALETGAVPPNVPVVFNKLPTTISGNWRPIILPAASQEVDYEAELVVVIGQGGRHIKRENAYDHIAGYCCGNDVSARDWQIRKPGGQWLLGKSFDSFAPTGPALVTRDEVPNPGELAIELRLNGKVMQHSHTSQLIFPVDMLVAYVSTVCTLAPGDLLFTGTPAGVGLARRPPVFLRPGDVVEVEIEKLGILRNPVVDEK